MGVLPNLGGGGVEDGEARGGKFGAETVRGGEIFGRTGGLAGGEEFLLVGSGKGRVSEEIEAEPAVDGLPEFERVDGLAVDEGKSGGGVEVVVERGKEVGEQVVD